MGKDEALFCNGSCQQWLHRYCAGVNAKCYKEIKEKGSSFLCYSCSDALHMQEITMLKDSVELLKQELAVLKESVTSAHYQSIAPATSDGDLPQAQLCFGYSQW